jgi:hypothetical protein
MTEQQAKAQSDGVSVEVLLPLFLYVAWYTDKIENERTSSFREQ